MSSRPRGEKRRSRSAPRAASADGVWLYGRHAVAAALANPQRRVLRLLSVGDYSTPLPRDLTAERVERGALEALLPPHAPHQGLAALCAQLDDVPLDVIAAAVAPGRPVLLLDQVTDPQNVGAVLRSAGAFGAAGVVMQDRHAPPETGALAKAASGTRSSAPLSRVVNLARALDQLRDAGVWSVALAGDADQTIDAAPTEGPLALVCGAEGAGVRRLTRERCDLSARIPIDPASDSLNVSAAAAVALYAVTAARRASG